MSGHKITPEETLEKIFISLKGIVIEMKYSNAILQNGLNNINNSINRIASEIERFE